MPIQLINGLRFDNIKGDFYGGITAAVVALPLALAFGVVSGAGAIAGLYGAIFVGFFSALFGGTPAQVSGPTGPMTVVMAIVITKYSHDLSMAFTVVMMGGAFQILFGTLRIGQYIRLVPYPVISGFMSGIGCIIIIIELAPLFGHSNPPGGPLSDLIALPQALGNFNIHAVIIGAVTLALVFFLPRSINRILPAPLLALIVGTLAVLYLLPNAPVIGDIPTGMPQLHLPSFTLEALPSMVKSAIILALLGAIDSLLTSLIADNITRTQHSSNRELIGQGIGNMVAGVFGGIPGAGATMRTVVNANAGGRTPLSGALHALVLLALVLGMAPLVEHIPHAVLAGILLKVGIDIIDWRYIKKLRRAPRAGVVMMLIVLGLTVFIDLITAVSVGIVMASLLFVKRMADLQIGNMKAITAETLVDYLDDQEKALIRQSNGKVLLFQMRGPISFGAAKALGPALAVHSYDAVVLDLSEVPMIDTSGSMGLEDLIENAYEAGKKVFLAGGTKEVHTILDRLNVLQHISNLAATRKEALKMALEAVKIADIERESSES